MPMNSASSLIQADGFAASVDGILTANGFEFRGFDPLGSGSKVKFGQRTLTIEGWNQSELAWVQR